MFALAPIRLSPASPWPVPVAGYTVREVSIPKWYRSPEGYELRWSPDGERFVNTGRKHGDRLIVPARPAEGFNQGNPLSDSALVMNFAELDCTEAAVLTFASKYG